MRVHHLNCVSMCPFGGKLMDGRSRGLRSQLVCHCLLIEADSQLVLVDTGFGTRDVGNPARLSQILRTVLAPQLREEMTAVRQIEQLGFSPRDVQHVVLTHLDFDHAGGLDDFPSATVHMLADERHSATPRRSLLDRMRYRPQQWSTRGNWHEYTAGEGELWFGFNCVRGLEGVSPEVLLVPLTGHTLGHCGVAVRRESDWLLHAGDAYFYHAELDHRPVCTPGLALYQMLMEKDRPTRLWNQARLRQLRHEHHQEVTIFSAHDAAEFERLAGHEPSLPVALSMHPKRGDRGQHLHH